MNLRTVLTVVASVGILGVAGVILVVIFLTEPEAVRETAVKKTAMLVETTGVEQGTFRPTLVALGAVTASQDVVLQPRVTGEVVSMDPAFVPGGMVDEGQTLLRLDPADYDNALAQRRSELHQAEAELALERGRQEVARTERAQIRGEVSPEQEALILREPQLKAAQARVDSARAAVDQAELALQRTRIRAPFDGLVLSRDANLGSQVGPGDRLGRLVGLDAFWVEVTVPVRMLQHLDLPEEPEAVGPEVRLRDKAAWPEDVFRTGRVDSLVRQLDEQTRLARLLITVDDPLARDPDTEGPPLIAGAWVEAHIGAAELSDVIRIDRGLVRQGDTVWVNDDGTLRIHEVEVVLEDAEYAYLSDGLSPDAQVVVTDLSTVTDGAKLRTGEGE